jgi:hypothetical protein
LLGERETLRYFGTKIVGMEPKPGQDQFISLVDDNFEQLRVIVVRKGRRVGMTACAGLLAAWAGTVLAPQFREYLMPGEEFVITLVATSREQAGVLLGFVRRFLRMSSMLEEQIIAETTSSITLASGCTIEAVPCSARANRGRANGIAVLDEGAHFIDSMGNSSLPAVIDALAPPLAQFADLGLMVVISTPLDATGAFYELEQQASSRQFDDMASLYLPTLQAAPDLAAEAERARLRNPRQYAREWLGEYTSEEEAFPLDVYDACVDPNYAPPYADPSRGIVLGLDGAVSRDSMALVGVDRNFNLVYAKEWRPPRGGVIDHGEVLDALVNLQSRFRIGVIGYDPAEIHGLVLDGIAEGLPMAPVSQASGRLGGTMARYASALLESMHEKRLRLFPCQELRDHFAKARFTARVGADRLTKSRSSDQIDLAVALAMAVGILTDGWRDYLLNSEEEEYVVVTAAELARDYEQTRAEFYAVLAKEAARAGNFARARELLEQLQPDDGAL